ncbi:MAG: hypothetical protein GY801_35375 [bacterium]|nr:hypothetical protein [bacterium]
MIGGVEYKPDVCAYPYRALDKKHDIVKMEELPILAIEIVSPMQVVQKVVEKWTPIWLPESLHAGWLCPIRQR